MGILLSFEGRRRLGTEEPEILELGVCSKNDMVDFLFHRLNLSLVFMV